MASFTSEGAALAEVRAACAELGSEAVALWTLITRDAIGRRWCVADGEDLIRRALGPIPA